MKVLYDPFGSFPNMMSRFGNFMQNPMQALLQRRINVPQNMMNNPAAIMQHMMNTGMLNQQQYNMARMTAQQAQNNPMFQQMMGRR